MNIEERTDEVRLELFYKSIIKAYHNPEIQKDYQEWLKQQKIQDAVAVSK